MTCIICGEKFTSAHQRSGVCERCLDMQRKNKQVNHPPHYTQHPSGIECITITEHMGFTLGNVIKYVWRADLKGGIEDLEKARWYLDREIIKRRKSPSFKFDKDGQYIP